MTQTIKNLSGMQEIRVLYPGREDFLKKGMATHSRVLAWRIPWTEEPGGLQSMGSRRAGRTEKRIPSLSYKLQPTFHEIR